LRARARSRRRCALVKSVGAAGRRGPLPAAPRTPRRRTAPRPRPTQAPGLAASTAAGALRPPADAAGAAARPTGSDATARDAQQRCASGAASGGGQPGHQQQQHEQEREQGQQQRQPRGDVEHAPAATPQPPCERGGSGACTRGASKSSGGGDCGASSGVSSSSGSDGSSPQAGGRHPRRRRSSGSSDASTDAGGSGCCGADGGGGCGSAGCGGAPLCAGASYSSVCSSALGCGTSLSLSLASTGSGTSSSFCGRSATGAAGWSCGAEDDDESCSTCGTSNSGCAWILSRYGGREVLADYEFGLPLGRGTFGVTRLVTERISARVFACKTVCKERINSRQYVEDMRSEVSILQHLVGVPGVVQLRGAYEDCRAVNLVLELCTGGDLLDHILRLGRLHEDDAAAAARAIVLALQRCHARGVVHRDVKPENFLLAAGGCAASCRVSDFGVSAMFEPGQKLREVVGTPYYMAPEVLLRCYDEVRRRGAAARAAGAGCLASAARGRPPASTCLRHLHAPRSPAARPLPHPRTPSLSPPTCGLPALCCT
jgi:hypothetical protein